MVSAENLLRKSSSSANVADTSVAVFFTVEALSRSSARHASRYVCESLSRSLSIKADSSTFGAGASSFSSATTSRRSASKRSSASITSSASLAFSTTACTPRRAFSKLAACHEHRAHPALDAHRVSEMRCAHLLFSYNLDQDLTLAYSYQKQCAFFQYVNNIKNSIIKSFHILFLLITECSLVITKVYIVVVWDH